MNLVFIENAPGSGQIIVISEVFEGCVVSRRLEPGDSARVVMSRFKSIVIDEEVVAARELADAAGRCEEPGAHSDELRPRARLPRRREGGRSLTHHLRRSVANEANTSDPQRQLEISRKSAFFK
jgi:hypothetical protein